MAVVTDLIGWKDYMITNGKRLGNLLIKETGRAYRCEECGLDGTWNGHPIRLHVDHVDGNRENNLKSNLRFLCPNCHSQTDTYCGRNGKGKSKTGTGRKMKPFPTDTEVWTVYHSLPNPTMYHILVALGKAHTNQWYKQKVRDACNRLTLPL